MNHSSAFWWKIGYIVAIALLIWPLNWLSQPQTRQSTGGKLAQLRSNYDLSEANLGEIDAESETVKLAALGLRGLAVQILWDKANYYKMTEDWANFEAVLTQIANLQPHFYSVWDYQAHNLTYNTSVEFDDYHLRYRWVIEGIKFLKQGAAKNVNEPRITGRIGWFIGNKIGRADEHRQYRRLFKEDDDFHAHDDPNRPRSERDNWLVSKWYYKKAEDQVNPVRAPLRTTPLIFYSQATMSLINYAEALESDSTAGEQPKFGEVAQKSWRDANREIELFGARDLEAPDNSIVHLDSQDELEKHEKIIEGQLEELLPGEFDKAKKARQGFDKSNPYHLDGPDNLTALETPHDKRNPGQETYVIQHWDYVADHADDARRDKARKLVGELARTEGALREIRISRDIVNYTYWKTRCEAEPTEAALQARELMYKAGQEQIEARPTAAKKLYEQSFAQWRKLLDKYTVLREDSLMAEDLRDVVDKYRDVLRQLSGEDAKFPDPFILQDMIDLADRTAPRPSAASKKKAAAKSTADKSAAEKSPSEKSPSEKSSPEKSATEKSPAEKSPSENSPSEKSPAEKSPPGKSPAEKAPTEKTPSTKAAGGKA